jgi:hypothetical protein
VPLYFAYGANMDVAAMAQRCPRSKPIGVARLPRSRFAIMPNGWGNVVADQRRAVHGVLWDLALSDVPTLDVYEEVAKGLYTKIIQPVIKAGGGTARALVYVGKGDGGRPRPEYIAGIIASARHWGLPAAYIAELETFAPPGVASAPAAPALKPSVKGVTPRFATPRDRP